MIAWFTLHGTDLWMIFSSIVTTASMIVAITPTPKDDAIVAKIHDFVSLLALNRK